MRKKNLWFAERFTPDEIHRHRVNKVLIKTKTKYQKVLVLDTVSFGKCLVLDGEIQSAAVDEFIYHELLTHPAMLLYPNPKNVLILGGGEGATLREVLRHKSVQKVVMVDLDKEVVDFCKKHLTSYHQKAFFDKRVKLRHEDARKYLANTKEKFDVIISDLPCPIEGGPAYLLYTIQYYRILAKKLKPNGVFSLQAGSGGLLQFGLHTVIHRTLSKVFPMLRSFSGFVPAFDVPWAFIIATKGKDPDRLTKRQVDTMIKKRVKGTLRFYDGELHEGLFKIPKYQRELIKQEKRVITDSKPVFFYK
ncbi:MAG: polyamine aminopropyltransferase [bacterium]